MVRPALSVLAFLVSIHALAAQPDVSDARPSVALVLGGGGAHALAHVGILEELERQQVPLDIIAGTGLGGLIGGLYASGMTTDEIREFFVDTDWEEVFNPDTRREDLSYRRKRDDEDFLVKYRVGVRDGQAQLPAALIPNEKLARLLQTTLAHTKGTNDFDDLPLRFRTVGMDLLTGDPVVLSGGSLDRALLATLAGPGTLPPVQIDGRPLVSGSLIDNLPVGVARSLGADVIIVADMGPHLRQVDELNSVFGIVDQVAHIVQRRNSADSVASMRKPDILLRPELGTSQVTNLTGVVEKMTAGSAAVRAAGSSLTALAVDTESFAVFLDERQARRIANPVIAEIELKNDSGVDDALILAQLNQPLGAPLDREQLDADMRRIFGLGAFSSVNFSIRPTADAAILELSTIENRTGERFWRFGLSLQDDLEGNSAYTGSASFTWTQLNSLGAEWRNVFRIGDIQQVATEFYQPVDKLGRYFVSAGASWNERNVNSFLDGEITDQSRIRQLIGTVAAGRIIGNSAEIRAGAFYGKGTTRSNIGSDIPTAKFDVGGLLASVSYDTLDNIYFPSRGSSAAVSWSGQRPSMGASFDVDIMQASMGTAWSLGNTTLVGSVRLQTQLKDVAGVQNLLTTGGLFNLSGYQRDELSGRHTGVGRVIAYRQLRSNPIRGLLDASIYVGGSLELGNAWQASSEVKLENAIFAGSAFIGADTFIGPVYLAGGLAEGGQSAFYLYVGRPF